MRPLARAYGLTSRKNFAGPVTVTVAVLFAAGSSDHAGRDRLVFDCNRNPTNDAGQEITTELFVCVIVSDGPVPGWPPVTVTLT